jgi:hypothetical protein
MPNGPASGAGHLPSAWAERRATIRCRNWALGLLDTPGLTGWLPAVDAVEEIVEPLEELVGRGVGGQPLRQVGVL